MKNNYLISYNHSGNTLLRYFIEVITEKPTIGHNLSTIHERFKYNNFINKNERPILIKRHEIIDNEIKKNDNIILIIRDKNDCIKNNFEQEEIKYDSLLKFYSCFKGRKMVITYENIVNNTLYTCNKILDFINYHGKKNLNIDVNKHKEISLSIYRNSTKIKRYDYNNIINRIPAVQFTYDLWKAASLIDLDISTREWDIDLNRIKIRNAAMGFTEAEKLYFRPKINCVAVMFHYNDKDFWTHLTNKEFILCFPELKKYLKNIKN